MFFLKKHIANGVFYASLLFASSLICFGAIHSASAATCTFASAGGGTAIDFNTAGNWSCSHVPTNGDDVVIPTNTTTQLSAGPVFVSSVSSSGMLNTLSFALNATSTLTVNATGSVTSTSGQIAVSSTTAIWSGGTVSSTSGLLTFGGNVSSSGSIGSSTGNMFFSGTFQDNGLFQLGSGVATTTGNVTVRGTFNLNAGRLEIMAGFSGGGSPLFQGQNGTERFAGSSAQVISFVGGHNNIEIAKTGGDISDGGGDTTLSGYLRFFSATTWSLGASSLTVAGATTLIAGSAVTSSATTLILTGAVTSSGTIASNEGNMSFGSTFINSAAGVWDIGTGTATTTGHVTSTGTILGRTGTISALGDFWSNGTFTPSTGKVRVAGTSNQNLSGLVYYNFDSTKTSGTATLTASSTIMGSLNLLAAGGTLAIGTNVVRVVGSMSNLGTITENTGGGGKIIHTAESILVTNSSGTEVSSIISGGSFYLTVQDANRNLLGDTVETMTASVETDSGAGSDGETLTLTETGASTGIFRNTSVLYVVNTSVKTIGNNQIDLLASGSGFGGYVDAQDADDTASDSVTLTYVSNTASGSSSGGGGVGSAGSGSLPPLQTQYQSSAPNLSNLPVPIHTLVKLPDDGKTDTQYDSAVYYTGADGKRHAFPNANVYFTWYKDFSGVQVISQDQLASIPLGSNVTYKPGVKMVKFTTDPKVYVVAKGGILRWITSEAAALALYGNLWNKNIDDISDAFYANYSFGQDVAGLADFDPVKVQASVTFPSDSLQK